MSISVTQRVFVPEDVLIRELEGESVLLNLDTESYYGLDEIGTRMWTLLTTADSIQTAYELLLDEYDVAPEQLEADLQGLLANLLDNGLVQVEDAR